MKIIPVLGIFLALIKLLLKLNGKKIALVFYGGPGSGKGYLGERFPQVTKIVASEEIRGYNPRSTYSKRAKTLMEEGKFLPKGIIKNIFKKALVKGFEKDNYIILDGFPRSPGQARDFFRDLVPKDLIVLIVHLRVGDEESATLDKRVKNRGRDDAAKQAERFQHFRSTEREMLKIFQKEGEVLKISAFAPAQKKVAAIVAAAIFLSFFGQKH